MTKAKFRRLRFSWTTKGCRVLRRDSKLHLDGGHPVVTHENRNMFISRFFWIMLKGPIPDGLVVRHKCDNPRCVNLEHLDLGTPGDNCRDRHERGGTLRGEENGHAKLTENQAREILASAASTPELARRFGVSQRAVSLIRERKNWAHLSP